MTKQDLTNYSDMELSLQVFNTEDLYHERHNDGFLDSLEERFNYTDKQLEVLKQDLNSDYEENEA